jgi:folylpolyglutamate synthase/dihydropteroate synthase
MNATDLAELAQEYCNTYTAADFADAAKKALSLVDENGAVIICGSLYMAGDMKDAIQKELSNV